MSKIAALITLLEDPDKKIFRQVKNEIFEMGIEVVPDLENALLSAPNEDSEERLRDVLHEIQSENLCQKFLEWKNSNEQDLLELMILIEQIRDFSFQKQHLIELIVQIKTDIWLELNDTQTILEKTNIFDRILFNKYNFSSDETNPFEMSNSFMFSTILTKKGNDITLGVLYLYLAQTQHLTFWGVNLHTNFLLAYTNSSENQSLKDVLFYLNPFKTYSGTYRSAAKFSLLNLTDAIANSGLQVSSEEISPCNHLKIAERWLWTVMHAYKLKNDDEKLNLVEKIKSTLAFV